MEQPSAAKWNILGTNDASFNDGTGIADGAITPSKLSLGPNEAVDTSTQTSAAQTYTTVTNAPAVTVNIGANGLALVSIVAQLQNNAQNSQTYAAFAVSGASTVAASDNKAIRYQSYANNANGRIGGTFLVTGLTPGSNTFTLQNRVSGNTGTYEYRYIAVVPL